MIRALWVATAGSGPWIQLQRLEVQRLESKLSGQDQPCSGQSAASLNQLHGLGLCSLLMCFSYVSCLSCWTLYTASLPSLHHILPAFWYTWCLLSRSRLFMHPGPGSALYSTPHQKQPDTSCWMAVKQQHKCNDCFSKPSSGFVSLSTGSCLSVFAWKIQLVLVAVFGRQMGCSAVHISKLKPACFSHRFEYCG